MKSRSIKTKVFVSGPFTGKTWEQVTKERKSFHSLAKKYGLEIVEQFIGYQGKKDFENPNYNPSFILAKDKNFIKEADAFVIDLRTPSLGADCELTIAKELFDKKVYAVVSEKKKNHPWVRFYCDVVLDSFEEAFQKIKEDFGGKPHHLRIDKRQYDPIANEYRLVEETPAQKYIYDPAVLNFLKTQNKTSKVLVLHGASGYRARLARKAGFAHVTCVDISYKQIQIAKMEELRKPLGIEFFVLDPYSRDFLSSIPPEMIGAVDIVLGAFLLDHAMTSEELEIVTTNIHRLLSPNGVFFGLSDHPDVRMPTDRKYGVALRFDEKIKKNSDGVPRRVSIYQDVPGGQMEVLHFHNFRWKKETILSVLKKAGFSTVQFDTPLVSKVGIKKFVSGYWESYAKNPTIIEIIAKR